MRLLIATGGTGGHIYPAIALANAAKRRYKDIEILFVGNDDRMETTVVPAHGYKLKTLHAIGMTGNIFNKIKAVMLMLKAKKEALKIIDEFKPDLAIGFGGYVSTPVMLAAAQRKVKTMIHEQNSVVGMSNKVLMDKMDAIVCCYEKCFEQFDKSKTRLLGNPRASDAVNIKFDEEYYKSLGFSKDKPLIMIVMGSLGSSSINEMMVNLLPKMDKRYQFLFVTGKGGYEKMKDAFPYDNIKVIETVKQLEIIEAVDLLICRAGATTLAEITAKGTVSVMIPSPYVAHNHQLYNAKVLYDQKAALMIEEKDLNEERLKDAIEQVMENPVLKETLKQNALKLGKPNACGDILDWCEELIKGEGK